MNSNYRQTHTENTLFVTDGLAQIAVERTPALLRIVVIFGDHFKRRTGLLRQRQLVRYVALEGQHKDADGRSFKMTSAVSGRNGHN